VSCAKLKNNSFSIQVKESTDIINKSYIVVFVRFVNDDEVQEIFSCPKQAKGKIEPCLHVWKQKVSLGRIVLASVLVMPH
jgi:hypothetical protein